MYKIVKDPITNKILSCIKVLPNIPIYNTDILIDDDNIQNINFTSPISISDEGEFCELTEDNISDYDNEINILSSQMFELSKESENDYLMRLIIDEEKDLSEARLAVKERREQIESLKLQLDNKVKSHQEEIKNYYLMQNLKLDSSLNCDYYSAVVLLIKNENRYLKEWLDWHLNLGFDKVYIYDNGTTESVDDIVSEYSNDIKDKITIIDWSGSFNNVQEDAYNHFLENYKENVRWGLFIDSDEFLRFTDESITDVNTFLNNYENYTEVWGDFVEYNANGHETYEDLPVRERFTEVCDVNKGLYHKNFIQINRITKFKRHYAYYDETKNLVFENENSNSDLFVIDHYYTKSWEEWVWKISERGSSDPTYLKNLQEFFLYNPDMEYLNTGENILQPYGASDSVNNETTSEVEDSKVE